MQSFEPLTMGRSARVGQSVSTSPTSSSSSNAASRQKSCNACVRGKRRCDKTTPRCTRCAAKGLECVYQRVPPGSSPSSVTLAQSSNRLSEAAAAAGMGYNKPVSADMTDDDFEMSGFDVADLASAGYGHHHHHHHESGHRMGGAGGSSTATTSPELVLDPSLEFSIADLLGSTSSAGSSTGIGTTTPDDSTASMHAFWNLPSFNEPKADFPTLAQPFPFQEQPPPAQQQQQQQQQEDQHQHQHQQQQVIRDVAILNELRSASKCFAVDPLLVHDPRSSIGYMFDTLTKLYVGFVATRALPFAHPRLYSVNVPKTVMAAYCGAAAYASRSPETRAWAIKAVQNAAAEVHAEGARASTDLEKLARCHALLVLDSIRIFDGDLGLRYAAEREMGTLREWSMELVGIVREFEGDAAAKAGREQQPPATWDVCYLPCSLSLFTLCGR